MNLKGTAVTLNNLGRLYVKKNQYPKALSYLRQADTLIDRFHLLEEKKENLETQMAAYEQIGNTTKALQISQNLLLIKDSLLNREKMQSLVEMQVKYESEKKQREIVLLEQQSALKEAQLELRKKWIEVLILFAILIAIIAALILYLLRREKAAKRQVEALMQELHHRVKNNLQLLSSIFSLQARSISDEHALEAVKSGENRVNAMAIIHQKLYRHTESRSVDLREYLTDLIQGLAITYNYTPERQSIHLDIAPVSMDVDKIIPVGLIVNELVSNTFKYAFPMTKEPYLEVKAGLRNNQFYLIVKNNGPGFTRTTTKNSMGLNIINTLCRQLKADVSWNTENQMLFQKTGKTMDIFRFGIKQTVCSESELRHWEKNILNPIDPY